MFIAYCDRLYSQPPSANSEQEEVFLETQDFPVIGDVQNKILTSPITRIKTENGIKRLKNKSPGSDE